MTELHRELFEFDAFRLDALERRLLRHGEPVPLEPKVFETLLVLVRHERRLVGKAELMQAVWPDSFVEESNLTRNISVLRKALSPHAGAPEYIETVAKFGYRFVGEVRALKGDSADMIAQLRHNLPGQLTSFVGRDREISEIERMLASSRLVTLTGAGGCGKTRLALQVAVLSLPRFKDGAWFVDLGPLSEATLVMQTVATVLGVREGPTRSLRDSVLEHLRHRSILLVLDNCEHVIGACAELADALLRGASHLRILATSREGVGIAGETVWRVPPLSLPGTSRSLSAEALLEFEATRLFVERATTVDPSLVVGSHHVGTIADICHRLDGLPLAIELAAARVNVLSLEQINTRLHDRFRLLTGGSRTSLARQSTLRGTLDWSYQLLSETERRVLCDLSVFSGGWSLEAAEEVCSGDGVEKGALVDLLSHLVDKSLVVVEDHGRGERRYRFLESVRQYGRDRLLEHSRAERVKTRHLRFFFDLVRLSEPELMGPRQASWLKQLHLEHDNLRAALDWCMSPAQASEQDDRAVDFATALWWFWLKRGFLAEGRQWLERAVRVARVSSPSRGAKASNALANMAYFQGDFAGMAAYAAKSVALGREAGDLFSVAFGLGLQTIAAAESGDVGLALRLAGDCRAAAMASGNPWTAGPALYVLGFVAINKGDYDEASRVYEEAWNISIRDPWASSIHVSCLVGLRVVQGRLAEAAALGAEGLALCRGIEDPVRTAWTLEGIAATHAVQDRPLHSARLWGASEQLLDSTASLLPPTHRWIRDRHFDGVKAALGDTAFQAAFAEGWAMSMGQATQYALEGL